MSLALCLLCILLVPLAIAGLALMHQGLGRARSAAHAMLSTLCALGVAAIVFVLIGSSWAGFAGGAIHSLRIGGTAWNWLGAEPFLAHGIRSNLILNPYPALVLCLQLFAVGMVVLIPLSAGNDRWRLKAICVSTALLAGFLYPLFSHWVWGGGWLTQLPTLFGLPAFVDSGGAGVVQVVGGLAALSVAWIIGPRQGKYSEGVAAAIPGHNVVLVLFGCLLALVGWIGLDAAASILFYGAAAGQVVMVAINAVLSASAGCLAAVVTTQLRYKKPDASLSANGWIAGLVAGSAACGLVSPLQAVLVGLVAGGLVTFCVEALEMRLLVDDPIGAIAIHAGAGLWGLLATGLLAPATGSRAALLLSQLIGITALIGIMLPLIHIGNLLLNRFVPYRIDSDGDWQGMDVRELGAGAYPEFVMHADEFIPR
jgi:Amt family ammonium transporter